MAITISGAMTTATATATTSEALLSEDLLSLDSQHGVMAFLFGILGAACDGD